MTRIFLSYALEDEEKVKEIYHKLADKGFKPWMDKKDILPGERWEYSIRKAMRECDFFLVCLTQHSVTKSGYIQKEINQALSILGEKLDNEIYLIPTRLEDCEVPEKLTNLKCADLYEENGWDRLIHAIHSETERRAQAGAEDETVKVFLVAPQLPDDLATELTIKWATQLKKSLSSMKRIKLVSFLGKDALRANMELELKKHLGKPGIFVFIDHGERDRLFGADDKAIIDMDNIELLKNKFIYAIACKSASRLGHTALINGAAGYFGFNNNFHITTTAPDTFGRCFLSGLTALLKENRSPIEARERIEIVTNRVIDKLKMHFKTTRDARLPLVVTYLRHNLDFMVCLGDPNWRVMHTSIIKK